MTGNAKSVRAAIALAVADPVTVAREAGVDPGKMAGEGGHGLTEAELVSLRQVLRSYGVEVIAHEDGRVCVFEVPTGTTDRKAACSDWAIRLIACGSSLEGLLSAPGQRREPGSSMGVRL